MGKQFGTPWQCNVACVAVRDGILLKEISNKQQHEDEHLQLDCQAVKKN